MNDDYLWNKKGRDRDVEALEELLAPLRFDPKRGRATREPGPPPRLPRSMGRWPRALVVIAAAAAVLLLARAWIDSRDDTTPASAVARTIDLDRYGVVDVHAGSKVEVLRHSDEDIRLRLERGTIQARITLAARPRLFQVETPATTCVDLGCEYTLSVEPDGSTFVSVEFGQVAFVDDGRETWIPAQASCRAYPERGSGTPRWNDARDAIVAAVDGLDRAPADQRDAAARALIAQCTEPRDALTLWHLAHERDPALSDAAWTALLALAGTPDGAVTNRVDALAPDAAEAWKRHLERAWSWSLK